MRNKVDIRIKRVYDQPSADDGPRVLIDRLWPRGMSRESARIDLWWKEGAVSESLRRWFNHEPAKWEEFRGRYREELLAHPQEIESLLAAARAGRLTILFGAKDTEHNNAVVLKDFLEERLAP